MRKNLLIFMVIISSPCVKAWKQTIVNKTSGTLTREEKHLSGTDCTFSKEILKDMQASIGKESSSGECQATIKNGYGKKAQLTCDENGCELIQSEPFFSLEKTNGSYSIKE